LEQRNLLNISEDIGKHRKVGNCFGKDIGADILFISNCGNWGSFSVIICEVKNMTKNVIKKASKSGTPEGMAENFKKATVELATLHLLSETPMYV